MSWKFQLAASTFEQARRDWDAVNEVRGNHILLDSGFVGLLLKHFANGKVMLATNSDVPGMALLIPRKTGRWETFQPSQAPLGLFLLGGPDPTGEKLRSIMKKLPGYALELSVLQQDPDYTSIPLEQSRPGLERLDYIQTARIPLQGTFEDYWRQRGINLRHNLERRRRRLEENHLKLELVARTAPGEVVEGIREYGRLESSGWKGKDGTAVSEGNAQGGFYRDVFEYFCARREGVIYQLLVNGKVAASDLCLARNGMMIVLKTTYDEALKEYSPAFLMREEIMKCLFAEKRVGAVEFYGRVMDWHTRWTEEVRTLYHVNCFRHRWIESLKKLRRRST